MKASNSFIVEKKSPHTVYNYLCIHIYHVYWFASYEENDNTP